MSKNKEKQFDYVKEAPIMDGRDAVESQPSLQEILRPVQQPNQIEEPIPEETPIVEEEIFETTSIEEVKEEEKEMEAPKQLARVKFLINNGCYAEEVDNPRSVRAFFGKQYAALKPGDIIEF